MWQVHQFLEALRKHANVHWKSMPKVVTSNVTDVAYYASKTGLLLILDMVSIIVLIDAENLKQDWIMLPIATKKTVLKGKIKEALSCINYT